MCLALGVERLDDVAERIAEVMELTPPQGLVDKVRALGRLKSLADSRAKVVRSGPCQEVVIDPPDLDLLPIMTCWPDDGGPFITLPGVYTSDPVTGGRNVGMYRLQKHSNRTLGLHWQIHKDAAADWRLGAGRMEVAISLGTEPVTAYAGSAPLPKHIDELMMAGFLRGEPVEVVQCKTVDLQVPAHSEIVIEGYCERGVLEPEGPFGDHTGYYTPPRALPGAPGDRDDDAARPDLPVDRGRRAAGRGRLARQGDGAHLPAGRTARRTPRSWTTTCPSPAPSTTAASSRSARPSPGTHARSCTRSGARACCR